MYYAKYIKYKNKYLNLKYQLGGTFDSVIIKSRTLKDLKIPEVSDNIDEIKIISLLKDNLVGIKILQTNSKLLEPFVIYNQKFKKNPIYFYRFTDKIDNNVYILCSLCSYYDFLYNLYEHIEIEEVNINIEREINIVPDRIYKSIVKKELLTSCQLITNPLPIKRFLDINTLVNDLKSNLFIIIDKKLHDLLLRIICMYILFIGTIHVFIININNRLSDLCMLSLLTEYELMYHISIDKNIQISECRLYINNNKLNYKLNKELVKMMFDIYEEKKNEGYYANRLNRGDPKIDNKFLNYFDKTLLENCNKCISIEDIAFNTTLFLKSSLQLFEIKEHENIKKIISDFNKNNFFLINNNDKLYDWLHGSQFIDQLWEYDIDIIEKEIDKLKKKIYELKSEEQLLLVQKLNEIGFDGCNIEEILHNSTFCNDKKPLLYENFSIVQSTESNIDLDNISYIPELKQIIKNKNLKELKFNKQAVIMMVDDLPNSNIYMNNRKFFFARSFYISNRDNKAFNTLYFSLKLNRICFQCLVMRDWLIFPIRIINFKRLKSPLSPIININEQEFCGYFYTRFTDNSINFEKDCKDKLYFIYRYNENGKIDHHGNKYTIFYYTANLIRFDFESILPHYRIYLCEINWIFYTFIKYYKVMPHFYEFDTVNGPEIVVSRFSIDEIYCKYQEEKYNLCELEPLKERWYNWNYWKHINDSSLFLNESLLKTKEEEQKFIDKVLSKKIKIK